MDHSDNNKAIHIHWAFRNLTNWLSISQNIGMYAHNSAGDIIFLEPIYIYIYIVYRQPLIGKTDSDIWSASVMEISFLIDAKLEFALKRLVQHLYLVNP